jgi:hypothetical protein
MRRVLPLVTLASLVTLAIPAAASVGGTKEPCADIPLEVIFQQAAPKTTRDRTWKMSTISQHADLAEKATCSSITEPLTSVRPDESSALDDRFCHLLRSELARRGGQVTEGRSAVGNPGDSDPPNYTSCTLFSESAGQIVSVQAIYRL